jgi:hypothetical protein
MVSCPQYARRGEILAQTRAARRNFLPEASTKARFSPRRTFGGESLVAADLDRRNSCHGKSTGERPRRCTLSCTLKLGLQCSGDRASQGGALKRILIEFLRRSAWEVYPLWPEVKSQKLKAKS